ncbi:MAG: sodium:calcium antiporter [Candidatus Margulisiibacteriota bacterium]|nr:sodium:calcium antiporter [Candidatus Margulisiibacteriota bacterium]
MVWLKLLICAGIIFFAGMKITRYADVIAEKTGLGKAWIGLVLLATVTSLPELANGISAVTFTDIPDLAVGDLLGACMINMLTLALLDIIQWVRGKPTIFVKPAKRNVFACFVSLSLLLFTAFSILMSIYVFDLAIFSVSLYTLIIFAVYFVSQKVMFHREHENVEICHENANYKLYLKFLLLGLLIIVAGSWLPFIGGEIISVMGWGKTFVGVLFLGLATTLPELVVSISALRMGNISMSKGNLFGSNIFNIGILFVVDVFYRKGPLLASVSNNMIYAALFGALLTGVAFRAIKAKTKFRFAAAAIIVIYIISIYILYGLGMS